MIKQAAVQSDWGLVMRIIKQNPDLLNAVILQSRSRASLLHVAAAAVAPVPFVESLIQLGAFRTVKDAAGLQAVDIAKERGADELIELLTPATSHAVDPQHLATLQEMFHGLLRSFMLMYRTPNPLWLPQLSILTEIDQVRVWFPIPGMAGGFKFWLDHTEHSVDLHSHSWCRMSGGSGLHHRITSTEIVVLDKGFV